MRRCSQSDTDKDPWKEVFSIYGSEHVRASEYSGHFRSPRRVMSGSKQCQWAASRC